MRVNIRPIGNPCVFRYVFPAESWLKSRRYSKTLHIQSDKKEFISIPIKSPILSPPIVLLGTGGQKLQSPCVLPLFLLHTQSQITLLQTAVLNIFFLFPVAAKNMHLPDLQLCREHNWLTILAASLLNPPLHSCQGYISHEILPPLSFLAL